MLLCDIGKIRTLREFGDPATTEFSISLLNSGVSRERMRWCRLCQQKERLRKTATASHLTERMLDARLTSKVQRAAKSARPCRARVRCSRDWAGRKRVCNVKKQRNPPTSHSQPHTHPAHSAWLKYAAGAIRGRVRVYLRGSSPSFTGKNTCVVLRSESVSGTYLALRLRFA